MKKFCVLLIAVLISFPIVMNAEEKYNSTGLEDAFIEEGINYELYNYKQGSGRVNVYLFRGKGCSHCRDFLGYVRDTLVPEIGDKFNLITYEIWNDTNNLELLKKVFDYVGASEESGIPFILVGDKYYSGYSEGNAAAVKKAIEEAYNNKDKTDVVKDVIAGKTKKDSTESGASSTSVIVTVILCTLALGSLYIFKSNYDKNILINQMKNIKRLK